MKKGQSTIFYFVAICLLCIVVYYFMNAGVALQSPAALNGVKKGASAELKDVFISSVSHPLSIFIIQLTIIIVASRICAFLAKKVGQPEVMGEIIAGILLGPSLLGLVAPSVSHFIFPAASLGNIQMLSQVGLILFMFVIGVELDLSIIKQKAGAAFLISISGIILPFSMGIVLAYYMYGKYAPAHVPFYAFSLFTGIAMSITAFPVLARIIKERKLTSTHLGITSLTAAAAGDVIAWCALAIIIAVVNAGDIGSSLYTIGAVIVYVSIMLFVVKPLLKNLADNKQSKIVRRSTLAIIFITLLISSWCCEVIGIHALFGAFMTGIIMPQEWNFRKIIMDKIEDVALVLLLPLFFVATGLRTQVGLLNDSSLWIVCGYIILVAVVGKFGGSAIAARMAGETMKDSLSIGALMNTRGLVELVVLNIGYDLGILTPQVFTMMVIMALFTTLMTNPLLNIINRIYRDKN